MNDVEFHDDFGNQFRIERLAGGRIINVTLRSNNYIS